MKDEKFIGEWGKVNVRVPFTDKDLSEIRNAISRVKTFQIPKVNTDTTSVTPVIPKTIHCLIFTSRATNAVLDPDRAQPS